MSLGSEAYIPATRRDVGMVPIAEITYQSRMRNEIKLKSATTRVIVDGEKEESPTSPVKIPRPDFDLNSLERSSTRHQALSVWDSDEVSIAAIALFALGVLVWYNGYAGESAGR